MLALPTAIGEALAEYLRHERPISTIATVSVRRAGIPHGRSHSLRHTLACRLVNSGGSIKEVADVLRQRSQNTWLIYAGQGHWRQPMGSV